MHPSMWRIAARKSCLTNFDREKKKRRSRRRRRKTMSKDTERDVLIYKRLEEELIKPAAGMGESAESWRHKIFIHQPIKV